MNEDIGGHGSKSSNSIWLTYRAMETNEKGEKVPLGKFLKGVKQPDGTWQDEKHDFVCGLLQNVTLRDNPGKPERNVDPHIELIVALTAIKGGESYYYKLPFKAGSTAAMSITRRLPSLTRGELVEIGAFVKDGAAAVAIQKYIGQQKVPIAPADTGVEFVKTDGLTGAALKIARTQNEGLREAWVVETVKKLPYFEEFGAAAPAAPVSAEEYDPFAED